MASTFPPTAPAFFDAASPAMTSDHRPHQTHTPEENKQNRHHLRTAGNNGSSQFINTTGTNLFLHQPLYWHEEGR